MNSISSIRIVKVVVMLLLTTLAAKNSYSNPGENESLSKASKLKQVGKFEEAIAVLTKEIESTPYAHDLYYERGVVKLEAEMIAEAIADFTKAIDLAPYYGEAYNKRALAKYDLGDFSKAIKDNNKAIELLPLNAECYYNRGLTKVKLSNNHGALEDFTKAIELNPYYAFAYLSRGALKLKIHSIDEAEQDIDKSYELDGSNPAFYKYKALVCVERGENQKAIKFLKTALKMGYSEVGKDNLEKLIEDLSKK